jgi:hypothetical protein
MKRTSAKLKLKQRLELVRTTVRELTSAQLGTVHGGSESDTTGIVSIDCYTKCCLQGSGLPD